MNISVRKKKSPPNKRTSELLEKYNALFDLQLTDYGLLYEKQELYEKTPFHFKQRIKTYLVQIGHIEVMLRRRMSQLKELDNQIMLSYIGQVIEGEVSPAFQKLISYDED
jgi:hypothetical protein